MYEGDFKGLLNDETSLTARYLRGDAEIKEPRQRRAMQKRRLVVQGAAEHNLKSIDLEIPLDMLVCITGVSGSGKSTLIHDCIYARHEETTRRVAGPCRRVSELEGGQFVDDAILVDQSPIGRTPRSNPVTYIKVRRDSRSLFVNTRSTSARLRSVALLFQSSGGRCEVCQGDGTVTVEMQFLADVELVCEECKGTRFKQQISIFVIAARTFTKCSA